jgi:hypothetical protein
MSFNLASMGHVMLTDDRPTSETSIPVSSSPTSLEIQSNIMQLFSAGEGVEDDHDMEQDSHVMDRPATPRPSESSKADRRSMERLWDKVERQLHTLEWILASKSQIPSPSPANDSSAAVLKSSNWFSVVNSEFRNVVEMIDKQRRFDAEKILGDGLTQELRGKSSPSSALSPTIGSLYRNLYEGFLARKILKRTPTMHNRRTIINVREGELMEDEETSEGWISETRVEKAQRNLQALGIEVSHKPLTWKEHIFMENNALGRYGCFRPSDLRWSWTVAATGY